MQVQSRIPQVPKDRRHRHLLTGHPSKMTKPELESLMCLIIRKTAAIHSDFFFIALSIQRANEEQRASEEQNHCLRLRNEENEAWESWDINACMHGDRESWSVLPPPTRAVPPISKAHPKNWIGLNGQTMAVQTGPLHLQQAALPA